MELQSPPPMPAETLPRMMVSLERARPQVAFPIAKTARHKRNPGRRPNMSVSFPFRGYTVARAMRYPGASHEITANEPNSEAIVADNVEVIVLSAGV
jgi:hypothetical protein